jgi:tRNA A-37 threonylcarbamoyl transferase component Bud32
MLPASEFLRKKTVAIAMSLGMMIAEDLMSNNQIALKYRTPAHFTALIAIGLLFPVWGVMAPICSFMAFCVGNWPATAIAAAIFLSGLLTCICCLDTQLSVNEHGLGFPFILMPWLKFQRERLWNDVASVKLLRRVDKPLDKSFMHIFFKSGGQVALDLAALKDKDLEQLLIALDVWCQAAEKDTEIRTLHDSLNDAQLSKGGLSYTKMWEDEMSRRFSSTAFVPLSGGHTLRDGRLKVVKQIAFGGLSAIYLAQQNGVDNVVLKEFIVPDVDPAMRAKAEELFNREAQLLVKLSHPQIARVRDHFVENERTYMILDYVPGTDLRQVVSQRGPQHEPLVIQWASQVADILTYLHQQTPPVIHRDITPDNIVLAGEDRIVLIDFGAANEFVGTATGTLVGKQSYIAPEQFRGDTTPQSDIYSLGATMYFLLTSVEPTALSQSSPAEIRPQISSEVDQLVRDCTAFEVEERIPDVQTLAQRLRQLTRATSVST